MDVLAQHHKKNRRPHIPDLDTLDVIHMASEPQISKDDSDLNECARAPQNSLKQKDQPANPYQLSYYGLFLRGGVDENVSPYFLVKHSDCF